MMFYSGKVVYLYGFLGCWNGCHRKSCYVEMFLVLASHSQICSVPLDRAGLLLLC